MADKLLTIVEAAALIGRSPVTLRKQVTRGALRATRVGSQWVVTERELQRYVAEHRRERGPK